MAYSAANAAAGLKEVNKTMTSDISFFHWTLPNPIIISSGPLSTATTPITSALRHGAAAVITKTVSTSTEQVNHGVFHYSESETFNTEGYSPRSASDWLASWNELRGLPVIANIHAATPVEAASLAIRFEDAGAEVLELCVSCPTFGNDPVCFDIDTLRDFCAQVRKAVKIPVLAKILISMSKRLNREMVACICDCGIEGVTLSDSLPGSMFIDGTVKHGGLTGSFSKALVMRALHDIQDFDIQKIAVGGVFTSKDVRDYMNCGAMAVGVLTSVMKGGWKYLENLVTDYFSDA